MTTLPELRTEVVFEKDTFPEYSPFKEYISRIRCVVCQKTDGKDMSGEKVEPIDYVPDMFNVTDPAHVKTVGSGGPDAENIVPLCHYHHQELHSIGIVTFQLHYNINLKQVAKEAFDRYSSTVSESDHAELAIVEHNRILSRVHGIKSQVVELGRLLLKFRDATFSGKPMYEWCGFSSFSQYISAPIHSGGLGLSNKTMYRWINAAELKDALPEMPVDQLGAVKSSMLLPVIKRAHSETEKRRLFNEALNMNTNDLSSATNKRLGKKDPREAKHERIVGILERFFDTVDAEVGSVYTEAFAWELMKEFNK